MKTHVLHPVRLLLALVAVYALACALPPEERPPAFINGDIVWSSPGSQSPPPTAEEKPALDFGIGPWLSPERMERSYRPLLDYIGHHTNHRIILNITPDYSSLIEDLRDGRLDAAIMSSTTFAESIESSPNQIHYLVTSARKTKDGINSPFYYGYIVTAQNSGLRTLRDLKGKRLGFVDEKSASGYRFPLSSLLNSGIIPRQDFLDTRFLGSHDKVADAIVEGTIDAGAIWDHAFEQYQQDHNSPLRILAKTSPIPEEAWVASDALDSETRSRIKELLLKIDSNSTGPNGAKIFGPHNQTSGYSVQGQALYQIINETARAVDDYESEGGTE